MAQLAVDDEDRCQLDQGEVVLALLLPANEQAAEAVEPGVGHLHHPAARRVTVRMARWGQRLSFARLGWNVRHVAMSTSCLPAGIVVVAPIQTQLGTRLVGRVLGHRRHLDHAGLEQGLQPLHVRALRLRDDAGQRHPLAVGQQMAFGAAFAAVSGVGPRPLGLPRPPFWPSGALTKQPSADCHWRSSPTNSSYSCRRSVQAWANAPVCTHSWKRSCTVDLAPNSRGTSCHWAPVRSTQITPLNRGRSAVRGRPGFLRGLTTTSRGASRSHRTSSTRQIVGSSFGTAGVVRLAGTELMRRSLSVAAGYRRVMGYDASSTLP